MPPTNVIACREISPIVSSMSQRVIPHKRVQGPTTTNGPSEGHHRSENQQQNTWAHGHCSCDLDPSMSTHPLNHRCLFVMDNTYVRVGSRERGGKRHACNRKSNAKSNSKRRDVCSTLTPETGTRQGTTPANPSSVGSDVSPSVPHDGDIYSARDDRQK